MAVTTLHPRRSTSSPYGVVRLGWRARWRDGVDASSCDWTADRLARRACEVSGTLSGRPATLVGLFVPMTGTAGGTTLVVAAPFLAAEQLYTPSATIGLEDSSVPVVDE